MKAYAIMGAVGENVTYRTNGEGEPWGPGWLSFYTDPELAILLNKIISDPHVWLAEAEGNIDSWAARGICTQLTTIHEVPLPVITSDQRVTFAILCARRAFAGKNQVWDKWASNWLRNKDRSADSIKVAQAAIDTGNAVEIESFLTAQVALDAITAADALLHADDNHVASYAVAVGVRAGRLGIDLGRVLKEMHLPPKQKMVYEAAQQLRAAGKVVDAGNINHLVHPGATNEKWAPAASRVNSAIKVLRRKNLWEFDKSSS